MRIGLRARAAQATAAPRPALRILGIDPGTSVTGWGVVEVAGGGLRARGHGTIRLAASDSQAARLSRIYRGLSEVLARYRPDGISLEKVFFARNAQSALKLGQVRGVALLAAAERGVAVYEYSSAEIKQAAVGYGRASKEQVQAMVASLLRLGTRLSGDAADALAAAICHLHQWGYRRRVSAAARPAREESSEGDREDQRRPRR
jgi:crossover junction endodeoxyribonuclease RuvC